MKKWERLEEYLYERDVLGEQFNSAALAEDWGISNLEASSYIRCYQDAQRRSGSNTLFILYRVPGTRTKNAMWVCGERAIDARAMGATFRSDMVRRVDVALRPTMRRVGEKAPRSMPAANAILHSIEASLELLAALAADEDA